MDFESSTHLFDISMLKAYVRHLRRKIRRLIPDGFVRFVKATGKLTDKERLTKRATSELYEFLYVNANFDFTPKGLPKVSVVLILFNKAELTYLCLKSLLACNTDSCPLEVIIIDNNSQDLTSRLMERVDGVKYIKNADNQGFLVACNQANEFVTAPFLLLLNNDTEIDANSIKIAAERLQSDQKIGAVGARIILPSGKLQEAGSVIYSDATTKGYLRGESPDNPSAMFPRRVDYCSGAFLLTRSELFKSLGGFDTRYVPAYYEETDYCVEIQKLGYSVLYEPRVHIKHFEFGSAGISNRALKLMARNRLMFLEKHKTYLESRLSPQTPDIFCRSATNQLRILVIEDSVPHPDLGAGFPRSCKIINALSDLGHAVSLFPTIFHQGSWHHIYDDVRPDIEVIKDMGVFGLEDFVKSRKGFYDVVWVSRPHNMQFFLKKVLRHFNRQKIRLIYDAEALFSARIREEERVQNKRTNRHVRLLNEELRLASAADVVVSVSPDEANVFREKSSSNTFIIGHEHLWRPGTNNFTERKGLVMLGSLHAANTPNYDSLIWFLDNVLPKLKTLLGEQVPVHFAGNPPMIYTEKFKHLRDRIHFTGKFADLDDLLNRYRAGILPTRIASGIPLKAFDLASRGVPSVCTKVIAAQMGWQNNEQALVADWTDPGLFAQQCAELYTNKDLWERLRNGLQTQQTQLHKDSNLSQKLREILSGTSTINT